MNAAGPTPLEVDHVVVAAASLEQGAAWCRATLGVDPGPGGRHPLMATHNRLLSIASAAFPHSYFEIVAVDAAAGAAPRRRWFGLDDAALQARLVRSPRLVAVVWRSADAAGHRARCIAAGVDPGALVAASRGTPHGRLQWRITVRDDGCVGGGGAWPVLIEWDGPHPEPTMARAGVGVESVTLRGLPPALRPAFARPGVDIAAPAPGAPSIEVRLATPLGPCVLVGGGDD